MEKTDIVVIGGGAAGIMAAITAARAGAKVRIIEHNDRVGKKLLATGNGKCNLTNLDQDISSYHCEDRRMLEDILEQFGVLDTMKFFSTLGIYTKNKNGYIYPHSEQASAVLDVLRLELKRLAVTVSCDEHAAEIISSKQGFTIRTKKGSYKAAACIVAAGSKAGAVSGADGSGYRLVEQLGHQVKPVVPALVQLRAGDRYFKALAGVRTAAAVSLYVDGELTAQDVGELQLTAYGISGIPVFQISRYAAYGLRQKKEVKVALNFMPDFEYSQMLKFLQHRKAENGHKNAEEFLIGLLNKKLGKVILDCCNISIHQKAADFTQAELKKLQQGIQQFTVRVTETNTFREAQVCAGGIRLAEIKKLSLESKIREKLYFAGEILDVDGICGGYNLQWAWSSGYAAGSHAARGILC